jgi:DNA ligase-1
VSGPAPATPLYLWAQTAERVEATRSRLEKAAHVGELLSQLPDADLSLAARWFAGHAFEVSDGRTVNVGHAALLRALAEAAGIALDDLRARMVGLGDPGTLAHEVLPEREPSLTLADLDALLVGLAQTRKRAEQQELLTTFLDRASPLEARYAVRMLAGDLRIGLKEAGVEDVLARTFGADLDEIRRVNMLVGSLGETSQRARSGTLGQAEMRLFHPVAFMLAQASDTAAELEPLLSGGLAIEDKFDGIRCQAHVGAPNGAPLGRTIGRRQVALFSRQRSDVTRSFPEIAQALVETVGEGDWILDGELVALAPDGTVAPFGQLQKRLGRVRVSAEMQREIPVGLIVYDLLYADELWTERTLAERRARLDVLLGAAAAPVRLAEQEVWDRVTEERLDERFRAARARGNEGLMAKSLASPYTPGKRGGDWQKVKRALATLDVVVTSVERGSGKRSSIYSDYTFAVRASDTDEALLSIGKAYSGLTDAELAELSAWFVEHTTQQFAHGRVRLVEPEIVLEVAFDAVQVSKRHKSGYALRFPRIVRWRRDKTPGEIDVLAEVARLAAG